MQNLVVANDSRSAKSTDGHSLTDPIDTLVVEAISSIFSLKRFENDFPTSRGID